MFLPRAGSPRTPMLPAMMEGVEAAVIGGGAIGLAVARALAAAGVEPIVVLEKEPAWGRAPRRGRTAGCGPSSPRGSTSRAPPTRSRSSSGSLVNMAEVLGDVLRVYQEPMLR